ncbi:MAG: outer membrane protein assembly factor BamE, partial [Burkholderiaceae bacterium]
MLAQARCSARVALILLTGVVVAACGSLEGSGSRLISAVTPYKVSVVQGNFVSREQVEALQPGMSRQQVREILGTPLVTSLFHANRWEYVFTLKKPGEDVQTRKLTVFFDGDVFARSEGDEMPTEAEFVGTLSSRVKKNVPVLEATEAQLARYPAPAPAQAASVPAAAAQQPQDLHYEPDRRLRLERIPQPALSSLRWPSRPKL